MPLDLASTRRGGQPAATPFGADAAARLRQAIERRTRAEVRFDDGYRALYATDASNYRQVPIGVVVPRSIGDIVDTVALCREAGAPVLARGGGTSLAGQCCNVAVVIDTSKYLNRVIDIDATARTAHVEPGCVLDHLRAQAERHHLTFGPDPSTHSHNTLGGMIGNNSCGVHSVMSGRTADNVHELDIVTYDGLRLRVGRTTEAELDTIIAAGGRRGEIYRRLRSLRDRYGDLIRERYPKIPRRVSGYNLDELLAENGFNVARALVGSEGTCVFVLGAHLRLVPSPPARALVVLGYPDVFEAGDHVPEILRHHPVGLEGMDDRLVDGMRRKGMNEGDLQLLPDGGGWLLVEFGGDHQQAANEAGRTLMEALKGARNPPAMRLLERPEQQARLWEVRKSGLGATAHVPGMPDTWPGFEDSAVAPDKVGPYLRDLRGLLDRYGYACALYGHFGDGCIHVRIDFDLTSAEGIARYRAFLDEAADLVLSYRGSLSGEHGDGQARGALLEKMFGPELVEAFREFKDIWDPDGRMNPGKVPDADPPDAHLRLGADRVLERPETAFSYPQDSGDFSRAAMRCVGVGECRRHGGGVMCPSYMATNEEMHSTRGRARLLFEMLNGDPVEHGWRSEAVREALDLCLACKGCKKDCPVNVDMATYKAEFFSHYYKRRLRPAAAYSMGLIYWWSRAASWAPWAANAVMHAPLLGSAVRAVGGIAQSRQMPGFARRSFRSRFAGRGGGAGDGEGSKRKVMLWPDTFNNFFYPDTAMAAVDVLEAAGFEVIIPSRILCCGRPLYAWGMLDQARRQLDTIRRTIGPAVEQGVPLVGLEPACMSVFRDEMAELFPDDPIAAKLRDNSFMLGDFLSRHSDFHPGRIMRKAVVHAHCHHHASLGLDGERAMLDALGLDYRVLDSGCCGMAGSFGFEADHYEIAMRAGEHVLLPAVRAAAPDTLVITDGFSCREQVRQATGRKPLHLAEVLRLAIEDPKGKGGAR